MNAGIEQSRRDDLEVGVSVALDRPFEPFETCCKMLYVSTCKY